MRGHPVSANAEPGTGTQWHVFANEPCRCQSDPTLPKGVQCPGEESPNHEKPASWSYEGTTWYCGQQYWDGGLNDIATLTKVVGKSGPFNTKEPDECVPRLVLKYERYDKTAETPLDGLRSDRFKKRHRPTPDMP